FWRDLVRQYPDAKVIHTERDPEVWWKSFSQTIGEGLSLGGPPDRKEWTAMVAAIVTEQTFHGDLSKGNVLKAYAAHNAEVKRARPASCRLDYNIDEAPGWEPLCRYLGVAVPATPFPKTNSTAEFRARAAFRRS